MGVFDDIISDHGPNWEQLKTFGSIVMKSPLGWPEVVTGTPGVVNNRNVAETVPVNMFNTDPRYAELRKRIGNVDRPVVVYTPTGFVMDPGTLSGHERFHAGQLMLNKGVMKDDLIDPKKFSVWGSMVPSELRKSTFGSNPQYEDPASLFGSPTPPDSTEITFRPGSEADRNSYTRSSQGDSMYEWSQDPRDIVPKRPVVQAAFNQYMTDIKSAYPKTGFYLEANSPKWLEQNYVRTTPPPYTATPPQVRMKPVSLWTGK